MKTRKKKLKFDFKCLCRPKTKLDKAPPKFVLNFKVKLIEKTWGALVPSFVHLKLSGPRPILLDRNISLKSGYIRNKQTQQKKILQKLLSDTNSDRR